MKIILPRIKKYRIVTDNYSGFEAQVWRLWWPLWVQMGFSNTHRSVEEAEHYIKSGHRESIFKPKVIKEI